MTGRKRERERDRQTEGERECERERERERMKEKKERGRWDSSGCIVKQFFLHVGSSFTSTMLWLVETIGRNGVAFSCESLDLFDKAMLTFCSLSMRK